MFLGFKSYLSRLCGFLVRNVDPVQPACFPRHPSESRKCTRLVTSAILLNIRGCLSSVVVEVREALVDRLVVVVVVVVFLVEADDDGPERLPEFDVRRRVVRDESPLGPALIVSTGTDRGGRH
jgi:hypothetical protein